MVGYLVLLVLSAGIGVGGWSLAKERGTSVGWVSVPGMVAPFFLGLMSVGLAVACTGNLWAFWIAATGLIAA